MKGKILKVQERPSKFGGNMFYVFFSLEDGKSARSCLSPQYGNFKRWKDIITKARAGEEVILDGLKMKGSLVDADSFIREVSPT